MYLYGKWYKLTLKKGAYNPYDLVHRLYFSILQNNLLKPIKGVNDQRINNGIDFLVGIRGLKKLEGRIEK